MIEIPKSEYLANRQTISSCGDCYRDVEHETMMKHVGGGVEQEFIIHNGDDDPCKYCGSTKKIDRKL